MNSMKFEGYKFWIIQSDNFKAYKGYTFHEIKMNSET